MVEGFSDSLIKTVTCHCVQHFIKFIFPYIIIANSCDDKWLKAVYVLILIQFSVSIAFSEEASETHNFITFHPIAI